MYIKIRAATGVPGPHRLHEEFQELMAVANIILPNQLRRKEAKQSGVKRSGYGIWDD